MLWFWSDRKSEASSKQYNVGENQEHSNFYYCHNHDRDRVWLVLIGVGLIETKPYSHRMVPFNTL